jgi:hypothetical protein
LKPIPKEEEEEEEEEEEGEEKKEEQEQEQLMGTVDRDWLCAIDWSEARSCTHFNSIHIQFESDVFLHFLCILYTLRNNSEKKTALWPIISAIPILWHSFAQDRPCLHLRSTDYVLVKYFDKSAQPPNSFM